MDLATLTTFFGWASVINMGVLLVGTVGMLMGRGWAAAIHSKMSGLDEADLSRFYFHWLAQYKIGAFIFSIVPWVALKLMA